jgi:tetratricopeptide (TPR) repeat protein
MVYYRLFESIKSRLLEPTIAPHAPHWAIHARGDLNAAIAETTSPEVLFRTAHFLWADGRNRDALPFARKAMELEPTRATYKLAYFDALIKSGGKESLEIVGILLEGLGDLHGSALHKIGVLLLEAGELNHAATAFNSAAEREPEIFHHRHRLGNVFEKLGRTHEAYEVFKSCIDDGDKNPHVMAHYARLLIRNGELEQARLFLESCTRIDNDFPPFLSAISSLEDAERKQRGFHT